MGSMKTLGPVPTLTENMFESLKTYCSDRVSLTPAELVLLDAAFETRILKKREFLLEGEVVCDFVAFIHAGTIRHFHIKNGSERTCDLSFETAWVTDFQSFNQETPSIMHLQALEPTTVYFIRRKKLLELYATCPAYETFGRLMAESVAQRATDIAMSLSSEKPEERFNNLLRTQPELFQRVPQKHIANFLGISPESLSRIRKRVYTKSKP